MGLAEITSANIVGYQSLDFDKSGWMINAGVAFSNVAGDGSFSVDESMFGGAAIEGDQIITLDAELWDLNTYEKQGEGDGWVLMLPGGDAEFLKSIKMNKGDMLYFIPVEASELTIAGEVASLGEQSVTFDLDNEEGQWMFPLVNPFPIATTWGDLNTFCNEGDQLIQLDADLWDLNTYEKQGEGDGWVLMLPGGGAEFLTDDEAIAIPAGGSMYYIPVETTTWTVTL